MIAAKLLVIGCLIVVGITFCASRTEDARAHGVQHGFVSPAGPCSVSNAGDIEVVPDWAKNRYLKYRCVCIWTQAGYLVCYWKLVAIQRALKNIWIPSNTKNYYQARIVSKRVHWLAWHSSVNGCVEHFGWRKVVYVRHR